jgi:hypothetical protein
MAPEEQGKKRKKAKKENSTRETPWMINWREFSEIMG